VSHRFIASRTVPFASAGSTDELWFSVSSIRSNAMQTIFAAAQLPLKHKSVRQSQPFMISVFITLF
jgi:hypothetical protein